MRKRLMAAAAMAPLLIGSQAYAQQTYEIGSNTSTPVATATALNGAAADIVLNSGSTFTINNATPAITLNSNNNVTNAGTITSNNIDGARGIVIQGPFSGVVTNAGTINLTESYTPSTDSNTGFAQAPYASGSDRIAIQLAGPLTGMVNNTGTITIQGNNSAGISIDGPLTGNQYIGNALTGLASSGAINLTGNGGYAIHTTGEIVGDVNVSGAISVKGTSSVGVQTQGRIDGSLRVYSSITTTGYGVTVRETGTALTKVEQNQSLMQQGGSALVVQGDVTTGVFLGAPPTTLSATNPDTDEDGIADNVEGTSSLTTYGSAPALQIGTSKGPITLGNFGTDINAHGLIIEGAITANGIMDGASATAVDVGAGNAGVNLTGGIRVSSAVSATSYEADATGIHLESGVTGQELHNDGAITASVTSTSTHTAAALLIDSGASLTSLTNTATIGAAVIGDTSSAMAVVDHSGSIGSVTNYGSITATITPTLPGETVTGRGVALDLSANTTGVTLTQVQPSWTTTAPAINGDVFLGSGPNTVSLQAGTLNGTLSFSPTGVTAAPGSLTIDNGAAFTGALLYNGPGLAIDVANGKLQDNSATTVNASSLHVGGSSTLTVALDPVNNRSTLFNVAGAAILDPGAQIGATVISTPSLAGQTFTILKAGSLSAGNIGTQLSSLPYLFNGSLSTDPTANTISLSIRTKTPAEMGFNKAETAAFNAIYAALPQDTGIQSAIIGATTRSSLVAAYDQLLPNSSGDVFETARNMSKSVSRATADRFDMSTQKDDEDDDDFIVSGFWASEFYSGIDQQRNDNSGYHSAALGLIGGYDFGGTGVTISAASSNITEPGRIGDTLNAVSVVEAGLYAAPKFGALSIDARVGLGYLTASDRRQLVATVISGDQSTSSTVTRTAKGTWSGYDMSAHLGAGLQFDVSKHLFFQPRVYADVFHLHENAYDERGGGTGNSTGVDAFDFNVSQRNGTQTNGTASLVTGLRYGNLFVVSPQLELGYDHVLTGGPGATTARFAYGGPTFTVPANMFTDAAVARLTIRGDGNYVHFSLQGGGEYGSKYRSLDLKAVFRLTF